MWKNRCGIFKEVCMNCHYRTKSPCKECKERSSACWDKCSRYKEYKDELYNQKKFLHTAKNTEMQIRMIERFNKWQNMKRLKNFAWIVTGMSLKIAETKNRVCFLNAIAITKEWKRNGSAQAVHYSLCLSLNKTD